MLSEHAVTAEIAKLIAGRYAKGPESEPEIDACIALWRDDLDDLNDAELAAACRAFRRSTLDADRWWPTPGRIFALSPMGRTVSFLGGAEDADLAAADFRRAFAATGDQPRIEDAERHLDPLDGWRNAAMFQALRAVGGAKAWAQTPDPAHDARGAQAAMGPWRAAYVAARRGQAQDGEVVRAIATGAGAQSLLTVSA